MPLTPPRRWLGATTALFVALLLIAPPERSPAETGGGSGFTPPKLFVAWSPQGLPANAKRALERVRGVRAATPVIVGLDWILGSRIGGRAVDRPPAGYGFPFEVGVVAPGPFSKFVPVQYRPAVRKLRGGRLLMPVSEEKIRDAGDGLRLRLRSRKARVIKVVPDVVTQGFEGLMAKPVPRAWKHSVRYFLIRADKDVSRRAMRRAIESVTHRGLPLEIKSQNETRFLRYAHSVSTQMKFKRNFGEFAARPATSGPISIQGKWVGRHIRSERVPILGTVTCHRKLFRQMRGALRELKRRGLAHLVRPNEYAGCYNARFVGSPPGVRLSRHSWGIAFDINTRNNQFGRPPHQDKRLVKTMRKWGLTWGGRWPLPDGMHFEWRRFP
ncbi:MAG: M15 family metallopeptidase [Actinomycetota bacterium]